MTMHVDPVPGGTPPPSAKPSVLGGIRPDLTPAQLVSGVPIIVALLVAFGVWDPSDEQMDALTAAVGWAAALVLGDAGLRVGRGLSEGRKAQAAAIGSLPPDPVTEPGATGFERPPRP